MGAEVVTVVVAVVDTIHMEDRTRMSKVLM